MKWRRDWRSSPPDSAADQIALSIQPLSWLFGAAPTFCATGCPPLNSTINGIDCTPIRPGTSGFSMMSILAMVTLPASSSLISSSAGAIILHGPHQSAQKSTSTGVSESRTSAWKLASVTVLVAMKVLLFFVSVNLGTQGRVATAYPEKLSCDDGKAGL